MNRQERRAALRQKRWAAPRVVPLPKILDEYGAFADVDRLIADIKLGQLEYIEETAVLRSSKDNEYYEVVPALDGWISAWKFFNTKFDLSHDVSALEVISVKLGSGELITMQEFKAAENTILEQHILFRTLPRDNIASAARTKQIALLMGAE